MTSPTSLNALESAKRRAPRQKDRILHALRSFPSGLTDEELCSLTGLSASTCRPRRIELVDSGLVVDSGQTRRTRSHHDATIWRLATAEEREAFEARRQERELADLDAAILAAQARYESLIQRRVEARTQQARQQLAARAEVRT